jgi:integrase
MPAISRTKTRFVGVYTRYAKKRVGADGKPDICYDILYRVDGRQKFERVGWKSEGYSILDAVKLRHKRIKERRHPELAQSANCRIKTAYVGVYQRYSTERIKTDGKPDICYDIHYKKDRRDVWEKIGWESEGYVINDAVLVRGVRIMKARHPELQRILQTRDAEFSPGPDPVTVATTITVNEAWAHYKKQWGHNLKNIRTLEYAYEKHLSSVFGEKCFSEITFLEMEKLKSKLLNKLCPGTVKNIFKILYRVFNKCQEFGLIPEIARLPKIGFARGTADRKRERYLTHEEISRLFDCLQLISCDLYLIAKLSLYTGMRLHEIISLNVKDFDMQAGLIHVHDSKTGDRTAYMPDVFKSELSGLLRTKKYFVFCDSAGKKFKKKILSLRFSKIMSDIGFNKNIKNSLYKATFHTLRHTFCSWLAIDGVPIYAISRLVGHKSIDMTERYAKLSPDAMKSVLNETFQK